LIGAASVATCLECGAMALAGARFCVVCGAALPARACVQCGFGNIDAALYCAACGAALPMGAPMGVVGTAANGAIANGAPAHGDSSAVLTVAPWAPEAVAAAETRPAFLRWVQRAFGQPSSLAYRQMSLYVLVLIYFSVASIVFESIGELRERLDTVFRVLEVAVTALFALEFAANVYVSKQRWRYVFSFWGLIDLVAIVPSLLLLLDLRMLRVVRSIRLLRVMRMMRVMRVAKLTRLVRPADGRGAASAPSAATRFIQDLQLYLVSLFCVVIIAATLIYYAEEGVDGTAFTHIPAAMWWVMLTITMTGSGLFAPVTAAGRGIGVVTMLSGLGLFAWLVAIVSRALPRGDR
jgi:voltage-gated potassium channel